MQKIKENNMCLEKGKSGSGFGYSHSIVAGGFELMSYTTRLIPFTLLMISFETLPRNSYGRWHQSAVIPSVLVTALKATAFSYVRSSPITPTD
jgi:hypothetical protein